jgi:hypothetical protein
MDKLRRTCLTFPAIDNHAHPLLSSAHRSNPLFPIEGVFSEAPPSALSDAVTSLACHAASTHLARLLLGLTWGATWEQVKAARDTLAWEDLCRVCFEQSHIQCVLLDDGLSGVREYAESYDWHDQFARAPTKRIVRVESVAEVIVNPLLLYSE